MSAATFAASAALAPASTSAASSLNRISVPRAPLSARFLRPSLLSVSPSRRRSAAATTCSKRSRRAARGIVVSRRGGLFAWPGAGFLALPFPLSGLLALPRCVGQLSGRSRAARALRALWVLLYALRGAAFARSQLLLAPALGSSEGRAQHASRTPTPKCRVPVACPALGTAPHVWGKPLRACRIKPIEKNQRPPKNARRPIPRSLRGSSKRPRSG